MAVVPSSTRFIGFSELANLTERKTDYLNAISQPFSMEDISSSVGNFEAPDPYSTDPAVKMKITQATGVTAGALLEGVPYPIYQFDYTVYNAATFDFSLVTNTGILTTGRVDLGFINPTTFETWKYYNILPTGYIDLFFYVYGDVIGLAAQTYDETLFNTPFECVYTGKLFATPLINMA